MSVESGASPGEDFLIEKYGDLPGSKPVERASRKARFEGKPAHTKNERVDAYMDRLEEFSDDERKFSLLRHKILDNFTINTQNEETLESLAQGLYESERKLAIEQGRGADVEKFEQTSDIIEHYKPLICEKAEIQRKTLSSWLDYMQENDAKQPMWFRYFVVRNLGQMGTFDKEKMTYSKRTSKTIAPFPELNSEALGWVCKRLAGIDSEEAIDSDDPQADEKREYLGKIIQSKDFPKLYAFAQVETAGKLNRQTIEGEWRKYDQGSDYHILENDLKAKGTGWCTAEGSASAHLQGGDFYVYYTKGADDQYTEPRVAIRMEGDQVGEVRGVNHRQELEPELVDIAQERYHELPGGEIYDKKAADMKEMTAIYNKCFKVNKETGEKTYLNPEFTKNELVFLYEINSPIEGFGYDKDPRIAELKSQRNAKEDAPIVLGCSSEEIAWSRDEINENTKAYIGLLFKNIFTNFPNLEHIYTSFPEGKIHQSELEIGGKTVQELESELKAQNIKISPYAEDILHSPDFVTLPNPEVIKTARLKVKSLGCQSDSPTTDEVFARAQEIGFEPCPAEVGPHQRLKDKNQPMGKWYWIAMKQIADRYGYPDVFTLRHNADGLWLYSYWVFPSYKWLPAHELLFRLRKFSQES